MTEDKSKLTTDQVDQQLVDIDGWSRHGRFIRKNFVFENFKEINKFLPHLTKSIVEQNHHPDFEFISGQKKVVVEVTTHSEGGLTNADLNLARALNAWDA